MPAARKTARSSSPPRSPHKRQRLDDDAAHTEATDETTGRSKRPSAAEKREHARAAKAAEAEKARAELQQWIEKHDAMLCLDVSVTIEQLFSNVVKQLDFPVAGGREKCDWSRFRQILESRSAQSPDTLFIQCRQDDLVLEPDGLTGIAVDNFVVVSCDVPTLAPRHYIVRDHRPNADIEDNAPERVKELDQQNVKWLPITKADGTPLKAFLLHRPADVEAWGLSRDPSRVTKSMSSFSFGIAAPPVVAAGAPAAELPSNAPLSTTPSFANGFGSAAPPVAPPPAAAPTLTPSFSFGFPSAQVPSPAPVAAAAPFPEPPAAQLSTAPTFSFGIGLQPAVSAGNASELAERSVSAASALGFGSTELQLKVPQQCFTLWSSERVKEMRKDLKAGTRIVRPHFQLDEGRTLKIVMQSDMADSVEDTAEDLLLKACGKESAELKKLDAWIDECPRYNDKLQAALQKFRGEVIKEEQQSDRFQAFRERYYPKVFGELSRMVEERRKLVSAEDSVLQLVAQQLKEGKIVEKSKTKVFKYYPANNVCRFRPHGKVTGITEAGEAAICEPPAYVFVNPLLAGRAAIPPPAQASP